MMITTASASAMCSPLSRAWRGSCWSASRPSSPSQPTAPASPGKFQAKGSDAQVQGTRASELALFILFDSPVCCFCDSPAHTRGQPGADFLKGMPTVWDDTRVLDGEVDKHLVMARRSGSDWFLGALTDGTARGVPVKLDFLGKGRWKLRLWKDAADSAENAEHLEGEERVVTAADTLAIRMAPAGGCVARFRRQ